MTEFNRFYTNPFDKHIDKLDKLRNQLKTRMTTGNSPMDITPEQAVQSDAAMKHVEAAIEALRKLDTRK